ncbi:unnamed protein product [Thelazia callipaeda]|uniref:CAF1-p150_C2 domain-containing protein n=1 Tax=Thelazia callipaeda TaxID=103827 RepID=A0A0N5D4M5_THECL|nr:unnamed protein product [Thelazia callipaeda]
MVAGEGAEDNCTSEMNACVLEPSIGHSTQDHANCNCSEVEDFVREVIEAVAYTSQEVRNDSMSVDDMCKEIVTGECGSQVVSHRRRRTTEELAALEQKRNERKRMKMEQREAAIEEKRRKKAEAQKLKEVLRKKREEAKEQKRKEEELKKEQKRLAEEEKKEKRRIEEEAKKFRKEQEEKEREKKRKEEEERLEQKRREEDAVELRKKRESDRFLAFFDRTVKSEKKETEQNSTVLNVLPFFCKNGVSLAPHIRRDPLSADVHDNLLQIPPPVCFTLNLKKSKLFQFHDNWRPAYYGTWRKQSHFITGRRPFAKDTMFFDYEVDSDEEWEVPEGDDCDESLESENEEDSDDSSEDDGFIVQHGYLSEGEGEDDQDCDLHHEDSKVRAERLKAVADEWEKSLKQKSLKFNKPLVPRLWGPYFELPSEIPDEVRQPVFFDYLDDETW